MPAQANKDLDRLSKEDTNWAMQAKDYSAVHFSKMTQVNAHNVHHLKPVWSFSTDVLNGHEGGPLVIDGIMYVHTLYPNNIFAIDLNNPDRVLWQYKPKQNPTVSLVPLKSTIPSTRLKRSI
jgi:methanol dehydrogenase (cytochrome c) subunit 1